MPALFFGCLLSACAALPPEVRQLDADAAGVELTAAPFHAQERYQCGPAALLTILEHAGVATDLDTLVERVYLPALEGSLQAELLGQARAAGRIPYRVDGSVAALYGELEAGRPVLVLQNLGVSWLPRWHYAVVVGIDGRRQQVVLRSGTERRRVTALDTFLRTWRRSDYWGFVALRPGELPADPDPGRYFAALAALEETGHPAEAARGWEAAVARWPASFVARFGLANSALLRGDGRSAEALYRELLAERPELALVRNNLALSLLRQQRVEDARREAGRALREAAGDAALEAEIARTLDEIDGG